MSAFHTRSASNIINPGHWALNNSLNHLSSLVGSMQYLVLFEALHGVDKGRNYT